MKNIDLFSFEFVDRENERMVVKNFNHTSWVQNNLECLKMLMAQSDYRNIAIIINRLEKKFC